MAAVVVSLASLDGAAVQFFLENESLTLSQVYFVNNFSDIDVLKNYKSALISVDFNESSKACEIIKRISLGAKVYVVDAKAPASKAAEIASEVMLNGLILPSKVDSFDGAMVVATTPTWTVGTKDAIKLTKPQNDTSKWLLPESGENEEYIDEDELLGQAPAPAPTNPDDCEVGRAGKKACKNCTCGRAEEEAAGKPVVLTQEMLDNPQSGCGSCGLGDAFRCASCPYRGLPAFEMGKKIQLSASTLDADI
uniref:Anamorsin homolog n=1 Tax=Polytomella parva TaxID=51329 RepID=A0A7S0VEI6_9CHLO